MADEDIERPEKWTAADLVSHCEWAASKGYLNRSTGSAMATAVRKIFEFVNGEDWEGATIRDLDVADLFQRFEVLAARELTGASLSTYESRFRKALTSYQLHDQDPKGWGLEMQAQGRRRKSSSSSKAEGQETSPPKRKDRAAWEKAAPPIAAGEDLVVYPFPIRAGVMAQLVLPADLRPAEADRLAAFVRSIVVQEQRALSGPSD